MVSIKTILILNIIFLSLALLYYFRVEITGFVSDAATIMLSVGKARIRLTISINQTSYCPGEQVKITNTAENTGVYDTSGNLSTAVTSPSGSEVFSNKWNNVDLLSGELKSFESFLDFISSNETGGYDVSSSFKYGNGIENATRSFRFKSGIGTLTASPPQIEKTIKRENSSEETIYIWLKDACENTNVSISISSEEPGVWVNLSSNNVFLTPNILNTSVVNITVPLNTSLGNYLGQIELSANGQKISIPLIIHVAMRDIEVNITVVSTEKTVCRGSVAGATVNITKNNPPGELLMNVTYQILDPDLIIVANSSESVIVNTNIIRNSDLTVPTSSILGYYTYLVSVQYEEVTEQDSDIFEVINCEEPPTPSGGGGGGGAPAAGGGPALNYSMTIDTSTSIISSIPGKKETLLVTIGNTGNINLKAVKLSVEGVPSTWIKILPNEVDIPYMKSQEYLVVLNIPNNAASGIYEMKIRAVSRIESETKIVKLIIGKTLEETADLMLEEMEEKRTIATEATLTKDCIDFSKIIPIFDEGEKSREKGLNNYQSKNYEKSIDWFKHSIESYDKVINQVDIRIELKIDSLKSYKIGIFPVLGLKGQKNILEGYYSEKNYGRICKPIIEISRLKKLSLIVWVLLLIVIIVLIIIFLIIRKREKEGNRKEIMSRVKERLEEFQPEDIEESQDTIESA